MAWISILLCSVISIQGQTKHVVDRKGFVFGISIGASHTVQSFPGKSQNETDFGLDFKIGCMIKPNIALLLTSNVSGYEYSGIGRTRKRDFGILAPSLQYWLDKRLWLLGGIGLGLDAPVFFDVKNLETNSGEMKYHGGLGIIAAVGYEFFQKEKFTIDMKARIGYRNLNITEGKTTGISFGLLVGINFY